MKKFTMTKEQMEKLLEASRPVPYMIIGGHAPRSPQENANETDEIENHPQGLIPHIILEELTTQLTNADDAHGASFFGRDCAANQFAGEFPHQL